MLTDQGLLEVSEILSTFDLAEIESFVNKQILGDAEMCVPNSAPVDHLQPLYVDFQNFLNQTDDPDIISEINARFEKILYIFLNAIQTKYCVSISEEWISNHPNDLSALTISLYTFFILNHQDNVEEVLYNYIIKHQDELYQNFETLKQKKDASTLNSRKTYPIELAVITANIYDICTFILDHITPMEFFDHMNQDYIPLQIITTLYETGDLGGVFGDDLPLAGRDFTDCIAESFHNNSAYKAVICFNVTNRLRIWADKSAEESSDSE